MYFSLTVGSFRQILEVIKRITYASDFFSSTVLDRVHGISS